MEVRDTHAPAVILLVDSDQTSRLSMAEALQKQQYHILESDQMSHAEQLLGEHDVDLVISVIATESETADTITRIRAASVQSEIIILSMNGSIENAVDAIHAGAFTYMVKPYSSDLLLAKVKSAIQGRRMKQELSVLREHVAMSYGFDNIVGISRPMTKLKETALRIASTDITVLISGASGTGKELLTKAIHHHSRRRVKRLVVVDCSAIPEALIESELFGHAKGSFTSAFDTKRGLLEEADGGTLFLDEVHNMPASMQMKFLRFLQDSEIRAVGASTSKKVDVRIIAATNRDLTTMVEEGTFREDLFYRLNVIPLRIPQLSERAEDIEILTDYFLRKITREMNRGEVTITQQARERLLSHNWPGNVRELENTLKRAIALSQTTTIDTNGIQFIGSSVKQAAADAQDLNVRRPLSETQRDIIRKTLEENQWNFTQTAQELGIGRTTLWRKVKKFKLMREGVS